MFPDKLINLFISVFSDLLHVGKSELFIVYSGKHETLKLRSLH